MRSSLCDLILGFRINVQEMKNLTIALLAIFMTTSVAFAQQDENCQKTCMVERTIYEGALLGVKFGCQCGEKHKAGAKITEIIPETAAANSILRVNDIITSINDKRTKRRAQVIDLLSKMEPFEVVKFTFVRDGIVNNADITIGARTTRIVKEEVCCDLAEDLLNDKNVSVYPNPAVKDINIAFKKIEEGAYNFEIYNTNGVRLYQNEQVLQNGELSKQINVEDLDKGVYVVKVSRGDKTYSSLFAIKK